MCGCGCTASSIAKSMSQSRSSTATGIPPMPDRPPPFPDDGRPAPGGPPAWQVCLGTWDFPFERVGSSLKSILTALFGPHKHYSAKLKIVGHICPTIPKHVQKLERILGRLGITTFLKGRPSQRILPRCITISTLHTDTTASQPWILDACGPIAG